MSERYPAAAVAFRQGPWAHIEPSRPWSGVILRSYDGMPLWYCPHDHPDSGEALACATNQLLDLAAGSGFQVEAT